MVDLAVGVIIGAAFGKIVDSMVNDLIMPVVGRVTGGLDFTNYFVALARHPPRHPAHPRRREEGRHPGARVGQLRHHRRSTS